LAFFGKWNDFELVKTALAIVCSLVLVWTQVVLAQAPAAGVARVIRAPCHCCGKASCCVASTSPESQSAPAAPASSISRNQISLLAAAVPAWTLPDREARPGHTSSFSRVNTAAVPLYARNCARLI